MQNNNHLIVLILMFCVKQARLHIHCVWKKECSFLCTTVTNLDIVAAQCSG